MKKEEQNIKEMVKARYAKVAQQGKTINAASCCGTTAPSKEIYNIMTDDYSHTEGYVESADLGLGCGLPTQFAHIKKGDVVIDLGSGAGNDCFIARHETGSEGKVIGIDFTPAMINKARSNAEKMGYHNVEFREGDIDNMPVNNDVADVVVSNCVLNLVPNKKKVMEEMFRVLKPGGHFSVSDIVLNGNLPETLREDAEMYAGCVSGAIQKSDYIGYIQQAGFEKITIQKEKIVTIPEDLLSKYLSRDEIISFQNGNVGIVSITVYGEKPGNPSKKTQAQVIETNTSCQPGSGCC